MGFLDKFKKKGKTEEKQAENKLADVEVGQTEEKVKEKKGDIKKEKKIDLVKKTGQKVTGNAYRVLKNPIISEKTAVHEAGGVYTFKVAKEANKTVVKEAIGQVYGVKPKKTRIINIAGKNTRRGRTSGRRSDWKKAIITLPKGQSINIHEGV